MLADRQEGALTNKDSGSHSLLYFLLSIREAVLELRVVEYRPSLGENVVCCKIPFLLLVIR
jgi:hypothetical protein